MKSTIVVSLVVMVATIFSGICLAGHTFTVNNLTPFNLMIQVNSAVSHPGWVTVPANTTGTASLPGGQLINKVDVKTIVGGNEVEVGWQKWGGGITSNVTWSVVCAATLNVIDTKVAASIAGNVINLGGVTQTYCLAGLSIYLLKGGESSIDALNAIITLPSGCAPKPN